MLAKIWLSLSKILRITNGSLNWPSYMAFLRVHSLHRSVGALRWAPLSKVVLPACCGEGLLPVTFASGSALTPFQVRCWGPSVPLTWRKKRTFLPLYLARVCLSIPSPLGMDIPRNVLEWNMQSFQRKGILRGIILPLSCLQNRCLSCAHFEHIVGFSTSAVQFSIASTPRSVQRSGLSSWDCSQKSNHWLYARTLTRTKAQHSQE